MSLYESMIGLSGFSKAHSPQGGHDNTPPLSKEELEQRKDRLRAMNIKGLNI